VEGYAVDGDGDEIGHELEEMLVEEKEEIEETEETEGTNSYWCPYRYLTETLSVKDTHCEGDPSSLLKLPG
jgi:hypothetical protein